MVTLKTGEIMIQVGDLVKSSASDKVGIVTGKDLDYDLYYVLMHDATYTIPLHNLKPLKRK